MERNIIFVDSVNLISIPMKKLLLSFVAALFAISMMAQDCGDLFFSEYVEGSANNKTLEIYNPTNNPVDLSLYTIKRYSNGSTVPTETLVLSGTIQPKDAIVVTNGQTDSLWVQNGGYWSLPISEELYNLGDLHCSGLYPTPMYFNGDDALTLETITGGVIDIFGKIGEQPENGWNDLPPSYTAGAQFWTSWTEDQTLIRKPAVKQGVKTNPALFMVHTEWDSIPEDSFDSLGFHRCDCGQLGISDNPSSLHSLVVYPNPVNGNAIYFNTSDGWVKAEIISVSGKVVSVVTHNRLNPDGRIETGELEDGIYLVRVTFPDQTFSSTKIVIR
jgi:hypothetical protein